MNGLPMECQHIHYLKDHRTTLFIIHLMLMVCSGHLHLLFFVDILILITFIKVQFQLSLAKSSHPSLNSIFLINLFRKIYTNNNNNKKVKQLNHLRLACVRKWDSNGSAIWVESRWWPSLCNKLYFIVGSYYITEYVIPLELCDLWKI